MKLRILILLALMIQGCSWHKTFKQNDRQGQILPEKSIKQLKKGMSTSEVTDIIGAPLLYNINDDRWEYIEYSKIKGKVKKNKHLILTFKDNRLVKIQQF